MSEENREQEEQKLDWDSEIGPDDERSNFATLPNGTVCGFEIRKMDQVFSSNGNPMAKLEMICTADDGQRAYVYENVVLSHASMFRVRQFGLSIGHLQQQAPGRINWATVVGSTGHCKLKIDPFKGRDGVDRSKNKVDQWLPRAAEDTDQAPQAAQEVDFA